MSSEKPLPHDSKGARREADFYDLLAWFEVNRTKVLAGALVLVLVGFAFATARYMREQKELEASGELIKLRAALNQPTNTPAPQPSQFLKIAEDFSGTAAAQRARLLAATTLFTEGQYSEAEREFNAFIKDFANSPWLPQAAYGAAAAQEAQNKPEAVASYQKVASAYQNSSVADDARLSLARIHEMRDQPSEALRIYNEMLAPRPGAQPGESHNPEAESRREALLRAHPELNTTNAATNLPSPPSGIQLDSGAPSLSIPSTTDPSLDSSGQPQPQAPELQSPPTDTKTEPATPPPPENKVE